jgi:hypothetical protein
MSGFSYEHCRKVLGGRLNVSRQFNMRVAVMLHLDADELWQILQRQRVEVAFGDDAVRALRAEDISAHELLVMWQQLADDDRRVLRRVARGLLAAARRPDSTGSMSDN